MCVCVCVCIRRRQWQPTPVLLPKESHEWRSLVGCGPWGCKDMIEWLTWLSDFTFTFHFHALEKEMATHSSVLAWRVPGMGEPGGLLSMGLHRVRQDWSDLAVAIVYYIQLDAEFQRIAENLQSEQCNEIEENNRMRKTRDFFKKTGEIRGPFHAWWAQ